jgi:lipopolysaccharide export system protein LptA
VDIQANEQEFAENEVIAKGNVRIKYKDSTVYAPVAHLFRDAGGNPQKAVFTGHPKLLEGKNKIDAENLTFEIATSKVIAQGHAHSEVVNEASGDTTKETESENDKETKAKLKELGAVNHQSDTQVEDKIITDADLQEYERTTGKFVASGHVHVVHDNVIVKADKLQLIYGVDGKPETAVFTGNVTALQDRNTTIADSIIYSLSNRRLQANGHVRSTVIQEHKEEPKKKTAQADPMGMPTATASEPEEEPKDDVFVITSQTQDYSKDTNRMTANGDVHVFYEDTSVVGPSCVLLRNSANKAERIVMIGRSRITQPGKRWIADHIEMAVADQKVIATGNTHAFLTAAKKKNDSNQQPQSQQSDKEQLAATKVETTK